MVLCFKCSEPVAAAAALVSVLPAARCAYSHGCSANVCNMDKVFMAPAAVLGHLAIECSLVVFKQLLQGFPFPLFTTALQL